VADCTARDAVAIPRLGNHRLGGLLKTPEPLGLAGYPAGNLLQISGDVREFNPKAADPVRKLIDQAFAVRAEGRSRFRFRGLCNRHRCVPPGE
jgi:hypothetical protein